MVLFNLILALTIFLSSSLSELDSLKSIDYDSLATEDSYELLIDISRKYRRVNIDSSVHYATIANELSKLKNYKLGITRSLIELGILAKRQGQFDHALSYYRQALETDIINEEPRLLAVVNNNIGNVHRNQGNLDSAIRYIILAIDQKKLLNRPSSLISSYINLAEIFRYNEQLDEARRSCQEAFQIIRLSGDSSHFSSLLLSFGNVYFDEVNYDSASYYFNEYIKINKENRRNLAVGRLSLGNIFLETGEYLKAQKEYKQCLDYLKGSNDEFTKISVLNNLGNVGRQLNQFELAIRYYKQALSKAKSSQSTDQIIPIYKNLSTSFESIGYIDSSLVYHKRYSVLNDSQYGIRTNNKIAELQTKYETEKKEREIITQKAEIQQTTSERNNLYLALLVLVILSGAAIFVYTQRSRNLKVINQKNAELHSQEVNQLMADQELKAFDAMIDGQEQERKRMAEELHDRLGSTLSATKMHLEALDSKGEKNDQVDYINKLLDTAIEDTRQISHNMLSGVLTKFGLVAALHDLKETISSTGQLEVSLSTIQVDERLELDKEINLYRITQELLSNTLKHAHASKFTIKLEKKNSMLELSVSDDGKGMEKNRDSSGIGLRNIESRVNKIGGSWEIKSLPGQGSVAIIKVPV